MSKKSLIKKPLSAYQNFISNRKKEYRILIGLNPSETLELIKEE